MFVKEFFVSVIFELGFWVFMILSFFHSRFFHIIIYVWSRRFSFHDCFFSVWFLRKSWEKSQIFLKFHRNELLSFLFWIFLLFGSLSEEEDGLFVYWLFLVCFILSLFNGILLRLFYSFGQIQICFLFSWIYWPSIRGWLQF